GDAPAGDLPLKGKAGRPGGPPRAEIRAAARFFVPGNPGWARIFADCPGGRGFLGLDFQGPAMGADRGRPGFRDLRVDRTAAQPYRNPRTSTTTHIEEP